MAYEDEHIDPFDRWIKSELEHIQPDFQSMNWEALDHATTEDELDFDNKISASLANLAPSFQPETWDKMAASLDAIEANDMATDKVTKQKLQQVHPAYQPEHWALLAKRMEESSRIKHFTKKYRLIESVLVLFILMSLANLLQQAPLVRNLARPFYTFVKQTKRSFTHPSSISLANTNQTVIATKDTGTLPNHSNKVMTAMALQNEIEHTQPTLTLPSVTVAKERMVSTTREILPTTTLPIQHETADLISKNIAKSIVIFPTEHDKPNVWQQFVSMLPKRNQANLLTTDEYTPILPPTTIKRKRKPVQLGFSFMPDFNIVHVPDDRIFRRPQDTIGTFGYGAGLQCYIPIGKNTVLETGGSYHFIRYNPLIPKQKIGNLFSFVLEEDLAAIQYEMIRIPLHINYEWQVKPKWKVYSSTGAAINLVVNALYEKQEEEIVAINQLAPTLLEENQVRLRSPFSQKEFPNGIFDGGNFEANHFFTLNAGIGVERQISERFSMFIQPQYQHTVYTKGLGPTQDRIQRLSLMIGAKVIAW